MTMVSELESIKNNLCSVMLVHSTNELTAVQKNITGVNDLIFVNDKLTVEELSDVLFRIRCTYNKLTEQCWKMAAMEFLQFRGYKYGRNDFGQNSYHITMATIISLVLAKQLDFGITKPSKSYLRFETKRLLLTFIRSYAEQLDLLLELQDNMFNE